MRGLLLCATLALMASAPGLRAGCTDGQCRPHPHRRATVAMPMMAAPTLAAGTVIVERSDGTTETLTYDCRIDERGWFVCEAP